MSIDEVHISEALNRYANGVVMTSTDLDRMQEDLHRRLRRSHNRRWRVVGAVAAALLLIAAIAGGAWWLRKPADPIPVAPPPQGSLTGLWKFENADPLASSLFVIRSDNSVNAYANAQAIVQHITGDAFQISHDAQSFQLNGTNAQGQACRGHWTITSPKDGLIKQGPQTFEGPGCDTTSNPESTITRLSPVSDAAKDLPVPTGEPPLPVTDTVQLDGVWLLQGTGVVLAVDEKASPQAYVLDDDGDIDTNPDARGPITIQPDGVLILQSAGCDTRLERAQVRGQGSNLSFTAQVAADTCARFGGRNILTWVRVL